MENEYKKLLDINIKKYLSKEEIINCGIEFAGEVCFSGEYGEQVYTK